jgi:hypothetical protein
MKTFALALVAAAALAAGAAAATAAKDARQLVLQQSDLPAGARATVKGGDARGFGVTYAYRSGGKPNEISAAALVLPSRAAARAAFADLTGDIGSYVTRIRLPRYGDEQVSTFHSAGGSQLIVRRGAVVWTLELQTFLIRAGEEHELTRAEGIAEYRRLAPKIQRRVGNG